GGPHVEPEHFRLMLNCASICRTSAEFLLSRSPLHVRVCEACAAACDACARSCAEIGGMDDCGRACAACAISCRQVAAALQTPPHQLEPALTHPASRPVSRA